MSLVIPILQELAECFVFDPDWNLEQDRYQGLGVEVFVISLHLLHIFDINRSGSIFDHIYDALGAIPMCKDRCDQVGIIGINNGVIGGDNIALRRVEAEWQFFKRNITSPFMLVCPTWNR